MGFTTPCFIVVDSPEQIIKITKRLICIDGRKSIGASPDTSLPCFCAVSTNMISFGNMDGLASAGFIDCGKNETLFYALAALTDNDDYWLQWQVRDDVSGKTNSSFNIDYELSVLGQRLGGYRRATAAELVAYFQ